MKQIMDNKNFMNPERISKHCREGFVYAAPFHFLEVSFRDEMIFNDVGGDTLSFMSCSTQVW